MKLVRLFLPKNSFNRFSFFFSPFLIFFILSAFGQQSKLENADHNTIVRPPHFEGKKMVYKVPATPAYGTTSPDITAADRTDIAPTADVKLIVQFKKPALGAVTTMTAVKTPRRLTDIQSALNNIHAEHVQFSDDIRNIDAAYSLSHGGISALPQTQIRFEYTTALNGIALTTKRWIGEEIQKLPYVSQVSVDEQVQALDDASNVVIGAPTVWYRYNVHGEGIDIGIIDTGIDYYHPALGGAPFPNFKVVGGYAFVPYTTDPMDDNGHGTHVAGIAAGDDGTILHGVAYKARLWAFKVLDALGTGTMSMVIAGIERALDPDLDPSTPTPISVLNLSLGGFGTPSDPVCQAINNAVTSGVVCCVAAGNSGPMYRTVSSPGVARHALTVGASDTSDGIASFSSRGSEWYTLGEKSGIKPDIVAPGVNIQSSFPGGRYGVLSGTSMATPHVAGAAALLRQLHPAWTADQIKAVLMESARDIKQDIWTQGSGRLSVSNAAIDSMIIEPPSIHFGVDDASQTVWTTTAAVKFTNTFSTTRTFALSTELGDSLSRFPGFSVTLNPSLVTIPSGGSVSVSAVLTLDNRISWYSSLPETFYGKIVAKSASPSMTIKLPFTFLKLHFIRCIADEAPFFLSILDSYNDYYFTTFYPWPTLNDTFALWNSEVTNPGVVFGTFWDKVTKIVKPNIPLEGIPTVYIRKADSKNKVSVRRLDQWGDQLTEIPGGMAWSEEYALKDKYSFVINWGYFSFFADPFMPTGMDTLYLPDLDSTFTLKLLSQIEHGGNFYVFPLGIEGGITSSVTLENDPSKFKRVDYTYRVPYGNNSEVWGLSAIHNWWYFPNCVGRGPLYSQYNVSAFYATPSIQNYHFWCTHMEGDFGPSTFSLRVTPMTFVSPDTLQFYTWTYGGFGGQPKFISSTANPLRVKIGSGVPMWSGKANNTQYGDVIILESQIYHDDENAPDRNTQANGQVQFLQPYGGDNPFFVHPLWRAEDATYKLFSGSATIDSGHLGVINGHVALAGSYAFEAYSSGYKIVDLVGIATARLEFEMGRADPNPPFITDLSISSSDNLAEDTYRRGSTSMTFAVGDDVGIDSVMIFFQPLGSSSWTAGTFSRQGNQCVINDLPDLPAGYTSMRLRVVDPSRNVLDYKMEPAFFLYSSVPMAPPLAWPLNGNTNRSPAPTLHWKGSITAQNYHLELASDSNFSNKILDELNLTQTFKKVGPLGVNTTYFWKVSGISQLGEGKFSQTRNFTTSNDSTYVDVDVSTSRGQWNIVSLPVIASDKSRRNVYPTSLSDAFTFAPEGYSVVDSLEHGIGYWLRFVPYDTFSVAGTPVSCDTIEVHAGWNLIGSITNALAVTQIAVSPSSIIASQFWGFQNGYCTSDTLYPGQGYWVKVDQSGMFILSSTSSAHAFSKIRIVATSEMPPPPPDEHTVNPRPAIPRQFALAQNYPNPFNPSTQINYELPEGGFVTLKLYNLLGQEVATLVNDEETAGYKTVQFNANNFPSGIYFYRLTARKFTEVKKMLLIR